MKIDRFEDIESWQMGREMTQRVYDVTNIGAFARDYGLKDQIRRASGSVMHNIAEGFDGGSNLEFIKFLKYAQRSCSEVQSQLYVAIDQHYIESAKFQQIYDLAGEIHSKIGGFIKYLLNYEKSRSPAKRRSRN